MTIAACGGGAKCSTQASMIVFVAVSSTVISPSQSSPVPGSAAGTPARESAPARNNLQDAGHRLVRPLEIGLDESEGITVDAGRPSAADGADAAALSVQRLRQCRRAFGPADEKVMWNHESIKLLPALRGRPSVRPGSCATASGSFSAGPSRRRSYRPAGTVRSSSRGSRRAACGHDAVKGGHRLAVIKWFS